MAHEITPERRAQLEAKVAEHEARVKRWPLEMRVRLATELRDDMREIGMAETNIAALVRCAYGEGV